MQKKIPKMFLDFQITAFEMVALNTHFYKEREYFSSGVNMVRNRVKISDTTKNNFFELILFRVTKECDKNTAVEI